MGASVPESPTVIVKFLDDEMMEGRVKEVTLERPEFELQLSDADPNNERALIPLPSVKWISLQAGVPTAAELARASRKVALRFQDGDVVKGYLDGELAHLSFGLIMRLLSVDQDRIETLAVPYTALKALFYVRSWDSRPPEFDGEADAYLNQRLSSPLTELISDIGQLEALRKRGAISDREFQRKRRQILDHI